MRRSDAPWPDDFGMSLKWDRAEVADDDRTVTIHYSAQLYGDECEPRLIVEADSEHVAIGLSLVPLALPDAGGSGGFVLIGEGEPNRSTQVVLPDPVSGRPIVDAWQPDWHLLRTQGAPPKGSPMPAGERIAADLAATTGHEIELLFDARGDDWWDIDIVLDQAYLGNVRLELATDPEKLVTQVVDSLCEQWLDEEIWGGWPICPAHQTHPLEPRLDDDGTATWFCPDGRAIGPIGGLGAIASP